MQIKDSDKRIIRELAKRVEEIAALPVQQESIALWKAANALKESRPPVRITEIPWNEMNMDNALTLRCEGEYSRSIETDLQRTLFQWKYFPANNVVERKFPCPMAVSDDGFGYSDNYKKITTDEENVVCAYEYKRQISTIDDVRKIRHTVVTHDEGETKKRFDVLQGLLDGILDIELKGPSVRFFPWDDLIEWFGIENGLMLMCTEPELVHEAIERLIDAHIDRLDQYEKLGVLTLNTGGDPIGSGGFGFTDEFPDKDFNLKHVRAKDIWGSSAAQIFASVSPAMHNEFAFTYEARLLDKFAMSYYGCCDPLDQKTDMLGKVKNLRKVSMSKWIDIARGTENIGSRYVFSYKPNPAVFAEASWSVEASKRELEELFVNAKKNGCRVEVIMKNMSTMLFQPQRLIEWAEMAEEVIDKHYGR